jgi:hypothetical protein
MILSSVVATLIMRAQVSLTQVACLTLCPAQTVWTSRQAGRTHNPPVVGSCPPASQPDYGTPAEAPHLGFG